MAVFHFEIESLDEEIEITGCLFVLTFGSLGFIFSIVVHVI